LATPHRLDAVAEAGYRFFPRDRISPVSYTTEPSRSAHWHRSDSSLPPLPASPVHPRPFVLLPALAPVADGPRRPLDAALQSGANTSRHPRTAAIAWPHSPDRTGLRSKQGLNSAPSGIRLWRRQNGSVFRLRSLPKDEVRDLWVVMQQPGGTPPAHLRACS